MNASDKSPILQHVDLDPEDGRQAVLQRFQPEDIQRLGRDELLVAQMLAGHGATWGYWKTPKAFAPTMTKAHANLNLAGRLRYILAKEGITANIDALVDEGVLVLTRWALLVRMVPSASFKRRGARLKPPSIVRYLYTILPRLVVRAITRKLADPSATGFFSCLTDADQTEFHADEDLRRELDRLNTLLARGLWKDVPPQWDIRRTTDPSQAPDHPKRRKRVPFSPLPDAWLAEIGPRVLWVLQDLGPNLLRLLEALPAPMKSMNWSFAIANISKQIPPLIATHLAAHPWRDRAGRPLTPPFALRTCTGKYGADTEEWPPRTWEQVIMLSTTLQAAHLFIALLACAGRIGEVQTLARGCVNGARDGEDYVGGYTYKLSGNLFGDVRQWPAPPILCQALGQQARLAAAWDWLPKALEDGLPAAPRFGDALWVSIGIGGATGEDAAMDPNMALQYLVMRLDMDHRPGGKAVHAHRFRKTVGRLAGVALFNSPVVLKRLFGHKSIEMTLHYILCDEDVRREAEKVLRELRIMHCAEALEEIHHAIANDMPLPGNGGAGAARLVTAVQNQEARLGQSGRVWTDGSAYELASLLTGQGKGWRLINKNIVCSKDWVCSKPHRHKELEVDKPKCDPGCINRVVLARRHRDTEQNIEWYLDTARKGRDEGSLLLMAGAMENLRDELGYFADLREKYLAMPDVQEMFALCEDAGEPAMGEIEEALV